MVMGAIRLPRNFETHFPQNYKGAVCDRCGRLLEVVHDYPESDWPCRFRCRPCEAEARARIAAYEAPIKKFEKDGMMLRWWMQNMPSFEPMARLRYIALVMQYRGTPEEYAIYESRYRM